MNQPRKFSLALFIALIVFPFVSTAEKNKNLNFYDLTATTAEDKTVVFSDFKDKAVLLVNITSKCGTTQQLKGLQELYEKYENKGLVVLGFPSEDFGKMDTKTGQAVKKFCRKRYKVQFPVFEIVNIKGDGKHEVFRYLTEHPEEELNGEIAFNFEKFLVSKDGTLKKRYGAFTGPMSGRLIRDIEAELTK